MNVVGTVTLLLLLLTTPALAAEYRGQVIDGRKLTARVYSYETGGLFDAEVEFRGDRATIHFASGGQLWLRLNQPTITDPANILGYGGVGQFPLTSWLGIGLSSNEGVAGTVTLGGGRLSDLWRITLAPETLLPEPK